jgi:hypothetical protein
MWFGGGRHSHVWTNFNGDSNDRIFTIPCWRLYFKKRQLGVRLWDLVALYALVFQFEYNKLKNHDFLFIYLLLKKCRWVSAFEIFFYWFLSWKQSRCWLTIYKMYFIGNIDGDFLAALMCSALRHTNFFKLKNINLLIIHFNKN